MLKTDKDNAVIEEIKEVEASKAENIGTEEEYSLNDDRRVKTLSPSALVAKRFFRNRLAVTGLTILIFMFLFSFVGGFLSPYEEDQLFYRYEEMSKEYAGVVKNKEFRFSYKDRTFFFIFIFLNYA
jgi:peptide/nickel transport system permease protein